MSCDEICHSPLEFYEYYLVYYKLCQLLMIIYATNNSLFTQYHQWIQYIITNLCTSNLAKFNSQFIKGAYGKHHKTDSFEGSL